MNNAKSNLAGLALRKYAEKSYWCNQVVKCLMTGMDYSLVMKYDLGSFEHVKTDIPMLKSLISDFGGMYIDLFTARELLEQTDYLPQPEYNLRQARIDAYLQQTLGDELYTLLDALVTGKIHPDDIPGMPVEIKEQVDLARLKYSLLNCDRLPTSEPLTSFEDDTMLDLVTSEDEPGNDEPAIEPAKPILTQVHTHSKPVNAANEPKPQGLQIRRSFSGMFEQ